MLDPSSLRSEICLEGPRVLLALPTVNMFVTAPAEEMQVPRRGEKAPCRQRPSRLPACWEYRAVILGVGRGSGGMSLFRAFSGVTVLEGRELSGWL